jgi:hypothetical protein
MRGQVIGTAMLVGVAAISIVAAQDATPTVGGMREADFIQVNLAALQFYASLNVLILAGYGFVLGHAWPDDQPSPSLRHPFLFMVGIVLAASMPTSHH